MSRHLSDLHTLVEDKARDWLSICKAKGYDVLITCTLRTNGEQDALYAKGRTVPGTIITNAKGGQSYHNYGLALDFCPLVNGKCAWDRYDLFKEIASIAKSIGFSWGGDWETFVDQPHLQMTFGLNLKDLQSGILPDKPHWAEKPYQYLLQNWVETLDRRFEDTITRGEAFSLLERVLKKMEEKQ